MPRKPYYLRKSEGETIAPKKIVIRSQKISPTQPHGEESVLIWIPVAYRVSSEHSLRPLEADVKQKKKQIL